MVPVQSVAQIVIVKLQSVTSPSDYIAIRGGGVHGKVGVATVVTDNLWQQELYMVKPHLLYLALYVVLSYCLL